MKQIKTIGLAWLIFLSSAFSQIKTQTIDFLSQINTSVNAAGPVLTLLDSSRDRVLVANTLTSSFTVIDARSLAVKNIPTEDRALQHLKSEAMVLNHRSGEVCLIGQRCFFIISPDKNSCQRFKTDKQFESIAVDESTGNVFLVGRESKEILFFDQAKQQLHLIPWLTREEPLKNLNATPPPPIRKVIADNKAGIIAAIDGYTSTLYLINPRDGQILKERKLKTTPGARWHFGGVNENYHFVYFAIETDKRQVVEAAKIDLVDSNDVIVELPKLTEGVGINYNPYRDELYIPYDNHATMHVVDFSHKGEIYEVKLPTFANDATAIDYKNDLIYVASWAHGEIDVVDLKTRKLIKRIPDLGIIPHMFNMVYHEQSGLLFIPMGATAVNGTFGAAIYTLNPKTEKLSKIRTGWAPIDLIEMKERHSFLVFNNEDQFAEVNYDGKVRYHNLPFNYPNHAILNPENDVYLFYGPHQSYWPNVYIWNAKNGILTIRQKDLSFYDRRIPRQAQRAVFDKNGVLYFTQNNWGTEEQFLGRIFDDVRLFDINQRLRLNDKVTRETSQRVLKYDESRHWLYLARVGETDEDNGIFQIISLDSQKVIARFEIGKDPTDLAFTNEKIYVSNFGSNTISVIDKANLSIHEIEVGDQPLKLLKMDGRIFGILHGENKLFEIGKGLRTFKLPGNGFPDNLFLWKNQLIVSAHTPSKLYLISFDPKKRRFKTIFQFQYPYGNTRFDTQNVSFYLNGQFGDAIYDITKAKVDSSDRLWVTDFLAGKLYILSSD